MKLHRKQFTTLALAALATGAAQSLADALWARLEGVDRIDDLVIQHVEQDHSGLAPAVLAEPALRAALAARNARLDEVQAAILRVRLRDLDARNARRARS